MNLALQSHAILAQGKGKKKKIIFKKEKNSLPVLISSFDSLRTMSEHSYSSNHNKVALTFFSKSFVNNLHKLLCTSCYILNLRSLPARHDLCLLACMQLAPSLRT